MGVVSLSVYLSQDGQTNRKERVSAGLLSSYAM